MIICYGSASVHHSSPAVDWGGVELFEDKVIPYLKDASAAVHQHGAKIFSQITHRGRRGNSDISWHPLFAPSGLPERVHRETPHAMEIEEIQDVVRGYGKAAGRLKAGGFDGGGDHDRVGAPARAVSFSFLQQAYRRLRRVAGEPDAIRTGSD